VKKGNGTLTLNGANTYTGNTIIWDGTVSISKAFMADWAGVFLTSAAKLNLNFAPGETDTVNALFIDGAYQAIGTWGAIGSSAEHQSSLFTGGGLLNVVPWETPPTSVPLAGDFNNDGKVDAGDYVTWLKANGTNNALLNDNGLGVPVGQAHLDLWRQNFGNARPAAGSGLAGGTIPEPSTILLALVAAAGLTATSRRRKR
jgi:autotransporter-associated beta strand protein